MRLYLPLAVMLALTGGILAYGQELSFQDEARQAVAQQMTDNAIAAFDASGEAVFDAIQDPDNAIYHDRELYVFVVDQTYAIAAHGNNPDLVGSDLYNMTDAQGTNLGELFQANSSPYGTWIQYYWDNPATVSTQGELKLSWLKYHGGYLFGVGVYPQFQNDNNDDMNLTADDRERMRIAQSMTRQAISDYSRDPRSAFAAIQDPDDTTYHDGELYVFVLDNSTIAAHGSNPDLVGTDTYTIIDTQGTNLGELFQANSSLYGRWIQYYWDNPATISTQGELKLSWVQTFAGLDFGVGVYPGYAPRADYTLSFQDMVRQGVARQMTDNAIAAFDASGEAAFDAIQDPDNAIYHDRELYVFVADQTYAIAAHGNNPDLVGSDLYNMTDAQGTNLGELFQANSSPYGTWIQYYWDNPATTSTQGELKLSWLKYHGGYLFGVGVYPQFQNDNNDDMNLTADDRERMRIAQSMTRQAISDYSRDPRSAFAAIQDPDDTTYHNGELYVFVLDNSTIAAHGSNPDLVGTDKYTIIDAQGTNLGELFQANSSLYGRWIQYYWDNPATISTQGELKLSWVQTFAGLDFGVGVYPGYAP